MPKDLPGGAGGFVEAELTIDGSPLRLEVGQGGGLK